MVAQLNFDVDAVGQCVFYSFYGKVSKMLACELVFILSLNSKTQPCACTWVDEIMRGVLVLRSVLFSLCE